MSWLGELPAAVGIDPGGTGALALVTADEEVLWLEDMPVDKDAKLKSDKGAVHAPLIPPALRRMVARLEHRGATLVATVVERVTAGSGQGVSSMFKFGRAYQAALDVAALLGDRFGAETVVVTPAQWKRGYGLTDDKRASCELAAQLLPDAAHMFWGPRGGPKDGRAEAALLARYALHPLSELRSA